MARCSLTRNHRWKEHGWWLLLVVLFQQSLEFCGQHKTRLFAVWTEGHRRLREHGWRVLLVGRSSGIQIRRGDGLHGQHDVTEMAERWERVLWNFLAEKLWRQKKYISSGNERRQSKQRVETPREWQQTASKLNKANQKFLIFLKSSKESENSQPCQVLLTRIPVHNFLTKKQPTMEITEKVTELHLAAIRDASYAGN